MKTVAVKVQPDHLERITKVKKPIIALAELIWNALDADATEVSVIFEETLLNGLVSIRVADNGSGMRYEDALAGFASLGGSWKRRATRSRTRGRLLHGRGGKGRFRAFSLGEVVEWQTRTTSTDDVTVSYVVRGALPALGTFEVSDPVADPKAKPGTDVIISNILKEFRTLRGDNAAQQIAEEFAIYLHEYPDVHIYYDGRRVDAAALQDEVTTIALPHLTVEDGRTIEATLVIIEWRMQTDRSLFLCDSAGFTVGREPPGIQAPGFQFTAYLRSDWLRELDDQQILSLDELRPAEFKTLLDSARGALRSHFRGRQAKAAVDIVEDWKKTEVYPFKGEPSSPVEEAKRQVFDVIALNVNSYLPDFSTVDVKNRRLSLRLLKEALEDSPEAVKRILSEVLELPLQKQNEFAELLDRTSLSAIIGASKLVTDRLDFLHGLEALVYDPESKEVLRERTQLHRILEKHTWLFGEEFNLTVSDQSLTEVLRKHLRLLGREELDIAPVTREDGRVGIVDLMLSRKVPQPRADEREHLVVELKRPSQAVDLKVISQLESYAFAVAADERFRDTNTRWIFWAISNTLSDDARRKARQRNRPEGLIHDDEETRVQIWVKTWSQVIDGCRARLRFFKEALEYDVSDESAFEYLKRVHAEYLPAMIESHAS